MALHREWYAPQLGPFVIPAVSVGALEANEMETQARSQSKSHSRQSSDESAMEHVQDSPGRASTSTTPNSYPHIRPDDPEGEDIRKEGKGGDGDRPPRLAHPSKLRSRDLTDVTFSFYLKHFLFFAPPFRPSSSPSSASPSCLVEGQGASMPMDVDVDTQASGVVKEERRGEGEGG